jgi:hypothetical protein
LRCSHLSCAQHSNDMCAVTCCTTELEAALKEFGKDLKDERWVKIAEKIDSGRTPKECKARLKELAKAIKAKKAKK